MRNPKKMARKRKKTVIPEKKFLILYLALKEVFNIREKIIPHIGDIAEELEEKGEATIEYDYADARWTAYYLLEEATERWFFEQLRRHKVSRGINTEQSRALPVPWRASAL